MSHHQMHRDFRSKRLFSPSGRVSKPIGALLDAGATLATLDSAATQVLLNTESHMGKHSTKYLEQKLKSGKRPTPSTRAHQPAVAPSHEQNSVKRPLESNRNRANDAERPSKRSKAFNDDRRPPRQNSPGHGAIGTVRRILDCVRIPKIRHDQVPLSFASPAPSLGSPDSEVTSGRLRSTSGALRRGHADNVRNLAKGGSPSMNKPMHRSDKTSESVSGTVAQPQADKALNVNSMARRAQKGPSERSKAKKKKKKKLRHESPTPGPSRPYTYMNNEPASSPEDPTRKSVTRRDCGSNSTVLAKDYAAPNGGLEDCSKSRKCRPGKERAHESDERSTRPASNAPRRAPPLRDQPHRSYREETSRWATASLEPNMASKPGESRPFWRDPNATCFCCIPKTYEMSRPDGVSSQDEIEIVHDVPKMTGERRSKLWPRYNRETDDQLLEHLMQKESGQQGGWRIHSIAPYAFNPNGKAYAEYKHLEEIANDLKRRAKEQLQEEAESLVWRNGIEDEDQDSMSEIIVIPARNLDQENDLEYEQASTTGMRDNSSEYWNGSDTLSPLQSATPPRRGRYTARTDTDTLSPVQSVTPPRRGRYTARTDSDTLSPLQGITPPRRGRYTARTDYIHNDEFEDDHLAIGTTESDTEEQLAHDSGSILQQGFAPPRAPHTLKHRFERNVMSCSSLDVEPTPEGEESTMARVRRSFREAKERKRVAAQQSSKSCRVHDGGVLKQQRQRSSPSSVMQETDESDEHPAFNSSESIRTTDMTSRFTDLSFESIRQDGHGHVELTFVDKSSNVSATLKGKLEVHNNSLKRGQTSEYVVSGGSSMSQHRV